MKIIKKMTTLKKKLTYGTKRKPLFENGGGGIHVRSMGLEGSRTDLRHIDPPLFFEQLLTAGAIFHVPIVILSHSPA